MELQELLDAGNDILEEVSRAIETNDFSHLNETITRRVEDITSSLGASSSPKKDLEQMSAQERQAEYVRRRADAVRAQIERERQRARDNRSSIIIDRDTGKRVIVRGREVEVQEALQKTRAIQRAQMEAFRPLGSTFGNFERQGGSPLTLFEQNTQPSTFVQRKVSRLTGLGRMIAGGTGIVGSAALLMSSLGAVFSYATAGLASYLVGPIALGVGSLALLGGSLTAFFKGRKDKELVDHYYTYGNVVGEEDYFSIKKLADTLQIKESKLLAELTSMMQKGYLPRARMDEQKTTLMLTDTAIQQYEDAERARREREAEAAKAVEEAASAVTQDTQGSKAERIRAEGEGYIRAIREANDTIPDTDEMSDKLYRLEEIIRRIFERVEKEPDRAGDLHKFMNYYLPTTSKLLTAYLELDRQPQIGENITRTRQEIRDTMDTINDAFEKLFNDLFQDMAWDISSDISVMKTMMAQDGLTGGPKREEK